MCLEKLMLEQYGLESQSKITNPKKQLKDNLYLILIWMTMMMLEHVVLVKKCAYNAGKC